MTLIASWGIEDGATKNFGKIESVNRAFLFWYWLRPKKYFFQEQNFFVFQDRKLKLLFENKFCETSQNLNSIRHPREKNVDNNCLN